VNILTIDPGYAAKGDGCACCASRDGLIVEAWFERPTRGDNLAMRANIAIDRVIVEKPQQDGRSWGVPPEVLIELTWAGVALGGFYAGAHGAAFAGTCPSDWKGSEAKPVNHGRLWGILSDVECAILGGSPTERQIKAAKRKGALERWAKAGGEYYPKSWLGHNLLDAAAINAVVTKRLKKFA
jgi:hypothetical protein